MMMMTSEPQQQQPHRDLVTSRVARQNVLNNPFALEELKASIPLPGLAFRGELLFTKEQVAELLGVDIRTIERYLADYEAELKHNGYRVLKGEEFAEFREMFATDINVGHKARTLSVFGFRSVLNLAMLLRESETAREIRSQILNIVIDVLAQRTDGTTRHINQRDPEYLAAVLQETNFRKQFTQALNTHIRDAGPWKFAKYTDMVYQAIFAENAKEYRAVLQLTAKDNVRATFYAEVINLIAAFEAGFAQKLAEAAAQKGEPLRVREADELFKDFAQQALWLPLIANARTLMASRDLHFRDAYHDRLEAYIKALPEGDFERFLGEHSLPLAQRIEETVDVYTRLKDR